MIIGASLLAALLSLSVLVVLPPKAIARTGQSGSAPYIYSAQGNDQAGHGEPREAPHDLWLLLIAQAQALDLPTRFLRSIRPGFVKMEFEDLHAFAAEYHPDEHRMILNRSLSFNAAGGALQRLSSLTHRDLGTLYHELFHAYMDYLASLPESTLAGSEAERVLTFARHLQQCRYQEVSITPILQRKKYTETRLLTERESWEALNETWAVFVGWAIWTKLELTGGSGLRDREKGRLTRREAWLKRLKKADRDGDLIGYYEPEDPAERAIARKRYLAPSHRISPEEVAFLLEVVLEESPEDARRSAVVMDQSRQTTTCQ